MEFISGHAGRQSEIANLFTSTFTASEGENEGKLVGGLVADMMQTTPAEDLFAFSAIDNQTLVGAIFFSRLIYKDDERTVFILSPVAVKTDQQKRGVGQRLITYGLEQLREIGVDIALTYGDPNYYSKTGFRPITEDFAKAPLKLSQPEGWLGQPLSDSGHQPLIGTSQCVAALSKEELW